MNIEQLGPGDRVYASSHIFNDGGIPGIPADTLLAEAGARGIIVETGYLEAEPRRRVYLVRFEDRDSNLGPPNGCRPEELSASSE